LELYAFLRSLLLAAVVMMPMKGKRNQRPVARIVTALLLLPPIFFVLSIMVHFMRVALLLVVTNVQLTQLLALKSQMSVRLNFSSVPVRALAQLLKEPVLKTCTVCLF
jgi:hypothetical protein